jgi:hypothetical protein
MRALSDNEEFTTFASSMRSDEIRPIEDQYVKEQLAVGNLKPAIMQLERIKETDAKEKRRKEERELKGLIEHQARLKVEIKYSLLNNLNTTKARNKLLKVNSRIGELKMRLDLGRLFDFQEDHTLQTLENRI